jgi:hypothetical protein
MLINDFHCTSVSQHHLPVEACVNPCNLRWKQRHSRRVLPEPCCFSLSVSLYKNFVFIFLFIFFLTSWQHANTAMLLRISGLNLQESSPKIFVLLKLKLIDFKENLSALNYDYYIYSIHNYIYMSLNIIHKTNN